MKNYKINRKLINVICDYCNNIHTKPESEYKRNKSLNRKNFCSRSCMGKSINNFGEKVNRIPPKVKQITNPFKYYFKTSKSRFKECTITLNDLEEQWNKQKGICPYSGIKLILNTHSKITKNKIYSASLDRIDSNVGYIKGNIQYVSQCINLMKNTMSHEETLNVCKIITKNWLANGFPLE